MQSEDRLRSILSDLGRSTLRGVRRCPKCGTYNGTRGLRCKNKTCDVVFKEAQERQRNSTEVCKINTGTSTQIYSVRVKDRGPDCRGFVQLPVIQGGIDEQDSSYLTRVSAVCFVDSCQRLFNTNLLKCHEREIMQPVSSCHHIYSAIRCCFGAKEIPIDHEVLNSLNISDEMKEAVWSLSSETPGPLVQRVSKTIMVVKCKVNTSHPLGFLHISCYPTPKQKDTYFSCPCTSFKSNTKTAKVEGMKPCVHYYCCVAAFASDPLLTEEFYIFIEKGRPPPQEEYTIEIHPSAAHVVDDQNALIAILENNLKEDGQVEVEILHDKTSLLSNQEFMLPDDIVTIGPEFEGFTSVVDVTQGFEPGMDGLESVIIKNTTEPFLIPKKKLKPGKRKKEDGETAENKRKGVKKEIKRQVFPLEEPVETANANMSFIEWLAFVTERINQTMHFQFDGKPEPLIFHTPQIFFDCLMERFVAHSSGLKRRRLPNAVSTFTRKDPPLGTFYSYTWHITNILHAKAIFDTPLMTLNVTRSFVQNPDGTYDDFDHGNLVASYAKKEGEAWIRPLELKTYLKIGNTSPDQEEPSRLSIIWTPNILPVSKIGELKITFEYGHVNQISLSGV